MNYLTKVIPQIPDSINEGIDLLIEESRSDSALFRYMLITLFNHFGKSNLMGMDAIQVHIAEKYYVEEATWSDPEFIDDLKKRIEVIKPLLIGKTAPDMKLLKVPEEHFIDAKNDTALKKYPHAGSFIELHKLNADYIVLLFWEADCSHCKRIVPELYKIYNETLKDMNVEVLAISTLFGEDGKVKWIDFVNKHEIYNWINAWNPYDYKYKLAYDIKSTPQIFVLDKEKTIIAKKIGAEQVPELIRNYKKINK
jgi:thiol-disulfide isomerase/thioredoxin